MKLQLGCGQRYLEGYLNIVLFRSSYKARMESFLTPIPTSMCGICNIEVIAKRHAEALDCEQVVSHADAYLLNFQLNSEELELWIHKTWMESFSGQLEKVWSE